MVEWGTTGILPNLAQPAPKKKFTTENTEKDTEKNRQNSAPSALWALPAHTTSALNFLFFMPGFDY
jgi:hypothetical protein